MKQLANSINVRPNWAYKCHKTAWNKLIENDAKTMRKQRKTEK